MRLGQFYPATSAIGAACRGVAITLGVALLLGGCSKVKEQLRPVELQPIEQSHKFVKRWARQVGEGLGERFTQLQPTAVGDVIYATGAEGQVNAYRVEDGKRLWRTELNSEVGGGLSANQGLILLGTLEGEVIALNADDGVEQWRAEVSSEIVAAPQSNGDVVIAPAIDGRVFAFDAQSGELRWSYDHPVPILSLRTNAAPLVFDNTAVVAFDNGQLLSFNAADGSLRWSARVGQPQGKTELERLIDVDSAPIAEGPFVYGAGFNSRIIAISRGSGRVNWSQDVSTYLNITAGDDKIIVTDVDSHVIAFNALTGTVEWRNDQLHRRGLTAPAVLDGLVVVADQDGYVHGLTLDEGKIVARRYTWDAPYYAQPLAHEDFLFLYNTEGQLMAAQLQALEKSRILDPNRPRYDRRPERKSSGRSRLP